METVSYYRLSDFIKALHSKARVMTSYGVYNAEIPPSIGAKPDEPSKKTEVVISDFVYFREGIKHVIHFEDVLGEKGTEEYKKMRIKADYMFRAIKESLTANGFSIIPASTKEEVNGMVDVREIAETCTKMIKEVIEKAKTAAEAAKGASPVAVPEIPSIEAPQVPPSEPPVPPSEPPVPPSEPPVPPEEPPPENALKFPRGGVPKGRSKE